MNQATKQKIINEAKEYVKSLNISGSTDSISKEQFEEYAKEDYFNGATKYAELLEQEKAKGEKLVEALEACKNDFYNYGLVHKGANVEKALTEYKK